MLNKDTPSWEHIRWIWFTFCVVEPTCIQWDIMICRHHFSWQKMILLELLLLHSILLNCIYFIGSTMTLSKIIGSTFGPLVVGHCLGISLHLQTPCIDQPLDILGSNMSNGYSVHGFWRCKENSKAVANFERTKYAACEFGKGHSWPNKVNTIKKNTVKEQELKKDNLLLGQMVYEYHYI